MQKLFRTLLLTGLLFASPFARADAVIAPAATAATTGASTIATGASALASGTWLVAKGVTGILWGVTKGLYHGGAAVGRGVGHLVHHGPKQPAAPE